MRWLPVTCGALLLTPLTPTLGAAQGANLAFQIRNGPNAGIYILKDPRGCGIEPQNGARPRTLKVTVNDTNRAGSPYPKVPVNAVFELPLTGSNHASRMFDIHLVFGGPDSVAQDYHVTTIADFAKTGTGLVAVDLQAPGDSAVVKFQARTANGVSFIGWIRCRKGSWSS